MSSDRDRILRGRSCAVLTGIEKRVRYGHGRVQVRIGQLVVELWREQVHGAGEGAAAGRVPWRARSAAAARRSRCAAPPRARCRPAELDGPSVLAYEPGAPQAADEPPGARGAAPR